MWLSSGIFWLLSLRLETDQHFWDNSTSYIYFCHLPWNSAVLKHWEGRIPPLPRRKKTNSHQFSGGSKNQRQKGKQSTTLFFLKHSVTWNLVCQLQRMTTITWWSLGLILLQFHTCVQDGGERGAIRSKSLFLNWGGAISHITRMYVVESQAVWECEPHLSTAMSPHSGDRTNVAVTHLKVKAEHLFCD